MSELEDKPAKPDDDEAIVREAKKRFDRCRDWEALAREHYKQDTKFVNGDSYNKYQWPDLVFQGRQQANAPALTINKTRQHCLQIVNDAKQNKPGVNIRPVGGGATFEAAQVFEGIVRHIEYISAAEQVYDHATTTMVQGGWGYWRVITDYASDDTFDQEIYLRRVRDPLSVYLDPDINEADGSDARYGFMFEDKPKQEFYNEFPELRDSGMMNAPFNNDGWLTKEHIRVAEYYRKSEKRDMLCVFTEPQSGQQITARKSDMPKDVYKLAKTMPDFKERELIDDEVTWYLIAGDKVIDKKPWAGKYIPIVRVIAEETVIDGTLDRKGHVRNLTDPQRIYNYWSSAAVEQVALQNKAPYVGPVAAFEGLEKYWSRANLMNFPYLPYNATDENGQPVQRPERQNPPTMAQAYISGMQIAQQEMMMASGQYQAQMGENENAKSGRAIAERQRQGDNATYHFIDGLAIGIRYTGKILIDLIPKIYDTPRVVKIMAEDGEQSDVTVDPKSPQAFVEEQNVQKAQDEEAAIIFNPNVGQYSVIADVGPAYATKRQEAFNAFTQILSQNANLTPIVGDLMFKNADFPGADEMAERLSRMVPPQAKGDAPPPEVQQMGQQLEAMQKILQEMSQQLAEKELALKDKSEQKDIDAYDAETRRIGTVANSVPEIGIDALKAVIAQTLQEMMGQPAPDPMEGQEMPMGSPMEMPQ